MADGTGLAEKMSGLNVMKGASSGESFRFSSEPTPKEAPYTMLHAGLDLSRKRLDVCVLDEVGKWVTTTLCPPDADGLRHLVEEVQALGPALVDLPGWSHYWRKVVQCSWRNSAHDGPMLVAGDSRSGVTLRDLIEREGEGS